MEQRPLGRLGPLVSCIGLGTAALGRPGYFTVGHGDDLAGHQSPDGLGARLATVAEAAADAGITLFDAARSYGKAEEFLARWIDQRSGPSDDLVISSKWGYRYVADWQVDADVHEVKDLSVEHFSSQRAETEAILGSRLSVFQIHSATVESGVLADDAVLAELTQLRNQGVIVGLSVTGPQQSQTIRAALGIERDGAPLFGTVQATWNPLEPTATDALAEAHDAGLGVIIKEAVANGRLTPRGEASPMLSRLNEVGIAIDADRPPSPDAVAIAYALAQPFTSVVLSGAVTVAQFQSNLRAIDIDPGALPSLDDVSRPEPATFWQRRSTMAWT